ncbi:MAG: Peptidase M16 domain protein [Parcubacteria group bacterium GW2011_GWD2_42_14]|nr:MAG: Peptidase M16 domain protein [Parcubacteria group bacterium GW2011_GWD2_42_14]
MSKKAQASKKSLRHASFNYVGTYYGIQEFELKKNGLRVLYQHINTAPVVGIMVTYLVGSRHEVSGTTGSTHILEHLMFKGSKNFPPKNGESTLELLTKKGALVNASTFLDRTNYYEVLPEKYFEFALSLEADRMRNACITKKDLKEELPAVRSEYAMHLGNDPVEFLEEKMWSIAFLAHPYHHSTIGYLSDIEHASVDALKNFYDTYYYPNNAVVTVIGSVEQDKALSLIAKYFGVHKKSPKSIPQPHTTEPEQHGRRFVEINREGTKDVVAIAFKVPEALHSDTPSVMALTAILAEGKNSRLYGALVDTGMASEVWSSYMPFFDPSLLMLYATPSEGVAHEKIEKALLDECAKIIEKGVTDKELAHVVTGVTTEIAFSRDGHYAMLSSLNESIAAGDWKFFFDLPRTIKEVTTKGIQVVAQKYLVERGMTVGYYRTNKKTHE